MTNELQLGIYQHYKGSEYEVIAIGRYEATLEPAVVYRALYESPDFGKDAVWIRPINEFQDSVEVDGVAVPRFRFLRNK